MDLMSMAANVNAATMETYNNKNNSLPRTDNITDLDRLKDVCRDFESIFIKQLLDGMKKTINKSGLISGGYAEELYEDMLYEEYSKELATVGSLGLADILYKQMEPIVKGSL